MQVLAVVIAGAVAALILLRIDWTPGRYKVAFYVGDDINVQTPVTRGILTIGDGLILIRGEQDHTIMLSDILSVDLFRLHGLGRMIRVKRASDAIFVSVVRYSIGRFFVAVDSFKTKKLVNVLSSMIVTSASPADR